MKFDVKATLKNLDTKSIDSQSPSIIILPDNSGKLTLDEMNNLLKTLEKEAIHHKG